MTYLVSWKVRGEQGWMVERFEEFATTGDALALANVLLKLGHSVHLQPIPE